MHLQTRASPDRARIDVFDGRHLLGLNQEAFARRGAEILGTERRTPVSRKATGPSENLYVSSRTRTAIWLIGAKCHAGNCISR